MAVFTANPSITTPLDLDGEVRAITAELDASGLGGVLQLEHQRATTPNAIQRVLLVERPTVVQFSGHGRARRPGRTRQPDRARRRNASRDLTPDPELPEPGGIMLHGDRGTETKVVSGRALGDLFARAGSTVRLVFLNACHSAQQVRAIVEHVDFVIGIDGAIRDEAAKVFSVALYRALALGRTIKDAFEFGVNALMLEGLEDDQELPILRARAGADPTKTTLVAAPRADDGVSWDVYVAYAKADREEVHRLAAELHQRHLRVFFDEWELAHGEEATRRLEQGVEGSTQGLMAVSAHTMAQPWVQTQYAALLDKAVTEGRRLIPVLIGRGNGKLPPFLRTRHPVDLRGLSEDPYREQVGIIARALRGQRPGPPPRMTGLSGRGQSSSGSRRSTARKPR
ncbi:TIR domain-containing protein [Paraliomyxa miuraensis]|uniref:TIR domain-containing protein n=1 Tax=Paraliomyxa miuraensis TaxID=376150 RepID=UPI0022558A38|nr:TIR domain-containing protein [Paraliomyxa miuraensis]MCX4243945.1 TIR domain-containing protein [Paraliomyxa miuraensis]